MSDDTLFRVMALVLAIAVPVVADRLRRRELRDELRKFRRRVSR